MLFVAVALVLRLLAGLPVWAAIAIPAFVVGGFEGLPQHART
jgi:hypothetical protein